MAREVIFRKLRCVLVGQLLVFQAANPILESSERGLSLLACVERHPQVPRILFSVVDISESKELCHSEPLSQIAAQGVLPRLGVRAPIFQQGADIIEGAVVVDGFHENRIYGLAAGRATPII